LDNAQRTVFLEDGCRLVGVLLELLAVGSRHCGYESVDVGHDVSPVTSGCTVTLAIYSPLKRFSRPLAQPYACVVSFPVPVASTALTILAQRLLYSLGRRHQTSVRQVFAGWYETPRVHRAARRRGFCMAARGERAAAAAGAGAPGDEEVTWTTTKRFAPF